MKKLKRQAQGRPRIVVFSLDPPVTACPMIRLLGPLERQGIDIHWANHQHLSAGIFDMDAAHKADLIVIQRHFPGAETKNILNKIIRIGVPIVYDLDDAYLDFPRSHPLYTPINKRVPYIKWMLKESDLVTVSTPALKASLRRCTRRPILVQPNIVCWELFDAYPRSRTGQFNLLVSGTTTHYGDWSIIEEPLAMFLNAYPDKVRVTFFGGMPARFVNHPSVSCIDFQATYKAYAAHIKELDIHAALVPLEDNSFNRCKSDIKWLEYSAAGIVGIFSNITPYRASIRNGENGLLVDNSVNGWFEGMRQLLLNKEATFSMLEKARLEVLQQRSIAAASRDYANAYTDLIGGTHIHRLFSSWPIRQSWLRNWAQKTANELKSILGRHILWRMNGKR